MHTFSSQYRFASLPPFSWQDIRPLTVVTGANGIGKSQLLLLIASSLVEHTSAQILLSVTIDGTPITAHRPPVAGYLPARWSTGPAQASAGAMYSEVDLIVRAARQAARIKRDAANLEPITTWFDGLSNVSWLRSIKPETLDELGERITHADVLAARGPYGFVKADPVDPIATLARVFFAHASARVTHLLQGKSPDEIDTLVGKPPWRRANQLLATFDVAFEIEPPIDVRFEYVLLCRLRSNDVVGPGDLSSGEQTILALVATIVVGEVLAVLADRAMDPARQPLRLLLLDEPDAHVHTSVIGNYLDHLRALVDTGTQIIMVTHRPETMLLCPPDSLVEMRRDGDQVAFEPVPPPRRPALIARLAADTVAVMSGTRVVWVEDEDDRVFHQGAYELALTFTEVDLPSLPPLAFMPAMSKPDQDGKPATGASGGGGWTAVTKRMAEFRAQGMQSVFRGLVDGDNRTTTLPPDVLRLDRYSIESYWADPLGLYQWAVHSDTAMGREIAAAGGIPLTDLNDLRSLDSARLQGAADAITLRVEASLPADQPRNRRDVTLFHTKGSVALRYPEWLWTTPKRLLTDTVTTALTGGVHNGWKKALRAAGFIPADLIDVYRRLIERL